MSKTLVIVLAVFALGLFAIAGSVIYATRQLKSRSTLARQSRHSRPSGVPSVRRSRQESVLELFGRKAAKIVWWTLALIALVALISALWVSIESANG